MYIAPNSGALNSRRKKLQEALKELPEYIDYECSCNSVMGLEVE